MKSNFFLPITPRGLSTIAPPPPWHYSGDFLVIEFWSDPEVVAALLPKELQPDSKAEGHAQGYFIDWQFTGENDEFMDPARYQYREFFILIDALYEGKPVSYCPYIFVDNDSAMARGWAQGFPKRLASVFQTRTFAAPSKASPRVAAGNRFAGSMSSNGQRLAEARVLIEKPLDDPSSLVGRPTINLRHFPQLAAGKHQTPAVHELVQAQFSNYSLKDAWVGRGELVLPECRGEELSDLAPLKCGLGFRASMGLTVDGLIILPT
jgi:acetoacetate decarboxylase